MHPKIRENRKKTYLVWAVVGIALWIACCAVLAFGLRGWHEARIAALGIADGPLATRSLHAEDSSSTDAVPRDPLSAADAALSPFAVSIAEATHGEKPSPDPSEAQGIAQGGAPAPSPPPPNPLLQLAGDNASMFGDVASMFMDPESLKQTSPDARDTASETRSGDTDETRELVATISGRVTDPEGHPAVAASVLLLGTQGHRIASGLTDSEGRFALSGLPEGPALLVAEPPHDSPWAASETFFLHLQAKRDSGDRHLVLRRSDAIEGLVQNEAGEPLAGAMIELHFRGRFLTNRTDESGRFRIDGLVEGGTLGRLVVSKLGYQPEIRTNLTMLEGFQTITLRVTQMVTLAVRWSFDETPVTAFTCRLLTKGPTGLFIDAERRQTVVDAPDGLLELGELDNKPWRVEVTVLTPQGETTDIRGAAEFDLSAGREGLLVVVPIDGGRSVPGTVVLDEPGGMPLEGAIIEFLPPSAGFGRFPPPASAFHLRPTQSDAAGRFVLEGLPPGLYHLTARKDDAITPLVVQLHVPYRTDPEPLEIVMRSGGVIHGTVWSEEGTPVTDTGMGISIQRVTGDGWTHRRTSTDQEGRYEFRDLPAGVHSVSVSSSVSGDGWRSNRNVDLAPGEDRQVDFDFSGRIEVTGTVRLNGRSAAGRIQHALFFGEDERYARANGIETGDTYHARVFPGVHTFSISTYENYQGRTEPFVLEGPGPLRRDFDIEAVTADIVLVFPSPSDFETGQTTLSTRDRFSRYAFIRVDMHQEARQVVNLIGSEYRATFVSRSGQWRGESDWVRVGTGRDNQFVLDVRPTASGARIGGWTPGQLPNDKPGRFLFDVTPLLSAPGNLEIVAQYESGFHAVETYGAALFLNGGEVDRAEHKGWTGADHFANAYRLRLPEHHPGARYEIALELRCDGGSNSTGSVYLTLHPFPLEP